VTRSHVCTAASHAAIKADPEAFAALPYRFTMRIEAGFDDAESWGAYDLVNRDCTNCGSTIAVEVPVIETPDCAECSGSGHGEQLTVDDFASCSSCRGTGHAVCAFCCVRTAHRVVGRDATCAACDERLGAL